MDTVSLSEMSKRVTWSPALLHKSKDVPTEEKVKASCVGSVVVVFSFVVGLRRIELAILALRLAGLDFMEASLPQVRALDDESSLVFAKSDGAVCEVPSDIVSDAEGVCTGIGRSIDSLEPSAIGMGILSDSASGLMGYSDTLDPYERVGLRVMGLMGDSVYCGGCAPDDLDLPGSDLGSDTVVGTLTFIVDCPGKLMPTLPPSEMEWDVVEADVATYEFELSPEDWL